jgi:hypothetical protein
MINNRIKASVPYLGERSMELPQLVTTEGF